MIKSCKILFIIFSCLAYPQNYWKKVQTPVELKFNTIFCLDTLNIWIGADSGKILYTSDKGNTWSIQNTGITEKIEDIFFVNANLGYALAIQIDQIPFRSYILSTTNGGNEWIHDLYRIENVHLHSVFFVDSLRGFIGGSPQELAYTTDGGIEWFYPNIFDTTGAFFPVYGLNFLNDSIGFAVGGYYDRLGVFWRTENFGVDWIPYALSGEPIFNVHIIDSTTLVLFVGDLEGFFPIEVYNSYDLGKTWEYFITNAYGNITNSDFRNKNEVWATLRVDRMAIYSLDTGYTWQYYQMPDSIPVYSVQFIDSLNGFMIGDSGAFFVYQPQDPSSVIEITEGIEPQYFQLFQNYPNPFNTQTSIEYFIESPSLVKINILNILGEKILELDLGLKDYGNHSAKIDLSGLPSGVYFYQLTVSHSKGIYSDTKKMVLLK